MDEKSKAFVIMPFDPEFNSIYEELIKPSLEEAEYDVARADSFLDQQNIIMSVVHGITTADLVIADLTTNNPNVFYELGLCHGLCIPTVLLAQSIDEVPFDLRSYTIQIYETHFNKIHKLKDAIKLIAEKHKKKEITFTNPITDFSSNKRGPREKAPNTVPDLATDELTEDFEEKGLLDYLEDSERATSDLTHIITKILTGTNAITDKINIHTASITSLSNNPGPGSAGKLNKILLLASSDINIFSKEVENILPQFDETTNRMNENYSGYLNMIDNVTKVEKNEIEKFRETIATLLQETQNANVSMRFYKDSVVSLNEQKLNKELNRATRRQAQALEGIISNIEKVEAFCVKTLAVIGEKFGENIME